MRLSVSNQTLIEDAAAVDRDLVATAQSGDREAIGELFMRHAPKIRRLLAGIIGRTDDLDDLVQEVFIQVHRSIGRFRGDSKFSTWLHQVATYTAYNYLRKPRSRNVSVDPNILGATVESKSAGAHETTFSRETLERLEALVEQIKPKKRIAFLLFAVEGHSVAEVAEMVDAPVPTVKSRIWFAKRELMKKARRDPYLAQFLEEHDYDDAEENE